MRRGDLQARPQQLEELYRRLPTVACQGLCASSCEQHVQASDAETAAAAAHGVELDAPTDTGSCPALRTDPFGQRRCSVHAVRPMICRLQGVAGAMPCPHRCTTSGPPLSDMDTLEALLDSLATGGTAEDVEGMRALLRAATDDPHAAQLLAGFLRGDRSRAAELAGSCSRAVDAGPGLPSRPRRQSADDLRYVNRRNRLLIDVARNVDADQSLPVP